MKAIVQTKYGPPEVLEIWELQKPIPEDDEVLIRVHAAVVSATDPVFRKGRPFISRFASGLLKPRSTIPGEVFAGEIVAIGKAVTLFKQGDPVFGTDAAGFGAHAEYKCMSEKGAIAVKPANMTYGEAAAVCDGALTALVFLRDAATVRRGQKVLIYGASGSIGTFAVQLAKHFGAEVTGVSSGANLEMVKSLGADWVIDYTQQDFTRIGRPYDVIFDTVGKQSYRRCKKRLRQGGVYMTTVPTPAIIAQMLWTKKFGKKRAVIAFAGLRPAGDQVADLQLLKELIEAGKITSVIDMEYPLNRIAEAHRYVETGHKKGNVILNFS